MTADRRCGHQGAARRAARALDGRQPHARQGRCPSSTKHDVAIRPMIAGGRSRREKYRRVGLRCAGIPVEFSREDMTGRRIVTVHKAMAATDGRWWEAAGPSSGRKKRPGPRRASCHNYRGRTGVQTWWLAAVCERSGGSCSRRAMSRVRGKIQRESAVSISSPIITDLSEELAA